MAVMKCVRITTTMKMGLAAVVTITMDTVTSAGMSTAMSRNTSTAMTKRAAAAKLILMRNMNMMPAAVKNMSTISTAAVVVMNSITTNMVMMNVAAGLSTTTSISMEKAVVVGNIITMNTKIAAAVDMNIITATMFRGTRRTVSAKSAIRMKNTATCAAKALKTAPAVCRTLTA